MAQSRTTAERLAAIYRIRGDAASIEARARALAVEQSVEMPVEAIEDEYVLRDIVGRVDGIADEGDGSFRVRIGLAAETVGEDAGQLLNMLFGNSSLLEDVTLEDVELPAAFAARFGGPRHGLSGLRARLAAPARALTCSAIKPQGLGTGAALRLTPAGDRGPDPDTSGACRAGRSRSKQELPRCLCPPRKPSPGASPPR